MPRRSWGFGWSLAAVCVVGAAIRVGYVLAFRVDLVPLGGDPFSYSGGASLLASGHGFIEPFAYLLGETRESASHPPLYLLWLALASVVDPANDLADTEHVQTVHMLWSCVLGTATIAICGLVGRQVAGARAGILAAAIAAVYPYMWVYDGMLVAETMAMFTVALLLWAAYRFWEQPSAPRVAWLGFCCGLAALARSEMVLTVVALLLPLALLAGAASIRHRLLLVATGGLAFVLAVGPWVGFNLSRFDAPVYLSTNSGGTAAAANCDSTYYGDLIGYKDYDCAGAAFEAAAAREPGWDQLDQGQQDQLVRREVLRYVGDHVDRLPVVVAARLGRAVKLYGVGQEIDYDDRIHGQERWVVYAGLGSWYVIACLAAAGAVVVRRRRDVPLFPLLAVPAIVLVAIAMAFAQTRYRAPAEPALVVLAAVALDAAWSRRKRRPAESADAASPATESDTAAVPV